ncbi:conserved hypothetical protein [Talaromyces stipitatus ATCC 10500]|uniref:SnoaL-like domain-containing protein n=1 Tax=Talaromyces stipitatus (strain ATCC 10500 / CBS 375.48 / QM 6759 / NRRL 1006) TaxID=441959 RepID=B8M9K9_TALSN|nr:uncharacterized protein TSTA_117830 [Talaromyces stipitatus ATCC 10500]EED18011.1 conserved hypothetical protein [Talaromyces stipitatus ATCC 10500]
MSYITENTIWPTAATVLPEVQELIRQFYVLADIPDPETGDQYATDIFTPTGMMKGPFGPSDVFVGEAEIRKSKLNAWKAFSSRRHRVKQVFVADKNGYDLMLIGEVELGLKNGKSYTNEYTCRMLVDQASVNDGKPRLALSSVWSDTSGVMAALK